jgi:hypothetical protein
MSYNKKETYEFKEGEIHIKLKPSISACYNFEDGKSKTIVLAPVVVERVKNKVKISWACSLGVWCPHVCRYSHVKERKT